MKKTHSDKYNEVMKKAESLAYEIGNLLKDQKINVGIAALSVCLLELKSKDDNISLNDLFSFIEVISKNSHKHTIN